MVDTEIYDKIGDLWNELDFDSSNVETKFKELSNYMDGIIDSIQDSDEAIFLRQY